jgi:DNA-binding IclR family transcriptional regulator
MTSPSRVFAVLGLFTEQWPVWHTDEINEALGYSRATGYRYVKDLVEAGFLQKVSAGRYALGPRIIELDHLLRRTDPVLLAAAPVMDALARKTRLDVVLSTMFGHKVIDIHRASVDTTLQLSYGRGRPRPMFLGAAPKVLLAHAPRALLVRLHAQHAAEIAAGGLGEDWSAFRGRLSDIRRQGFYLSAGELESELGAGAVPVMSADGDALAALALVGPCESIVEVGAERLSRLLHRAAEEVQSRLSDPAAGAPPASPRPAPKRHRAVRAA